MKKWRSVCFGILGSAVFLAGVLPVAARLRRTQRLQRLAFRLEQLCVPVAPARRSRQPTRLLTGVCTTGDVYVTGNNVTIRNSEIRGKVSRSSSGSFTIEDSTVGPTSGCSRADGQIQYSNYTARRVLVRNVGDAFRVSGSNVLIEDSFAILCSEAGDHSDGVQGYGGGTQRSDPPQHDRPTSRQGRHLANLFRGRFAIGNDSGQLDHGWWLLAASSR